MSRKSFFPALLLPSLVLGAACGSDPAPASDATPPAEVLQVRGTWRVTSGLFFVEAQGVDQIDFIQFDAEEGELAGTGEVYGQSALGAQGCGTLLFAQFGESSLSVSAGPISNTNFYGVQANGPDELTITAADGSETVLERVEAVPDEAKCQELAVSKMLILPEEAEGFSGLGDDGALLWYEGQNGNFVSVDPVTDARGSLGTVGFGQFTHVQAVQNDAFWLHCGCGGSQEAKRFTKAGVEELLIDTTLILPLGLSVRTIAVKGNGEVVVAGRDRQSDVQTLLVFDAAGTTLRDTIESQQSFGGIGYRDNELWYSTFTTGAALVQIDDISNQVVRTLQMPQGFGIRSFVFRENTVFILAYDELNQTVLLQSQIN